MFRIKSLTTFLLAFILLLGTHIAHSAQTPDEQVAPRSIAAVGDPSTQYGVFFEDSADMLRWPSILYGYSMVGRMINATEICNGLDDPACAGSELYKYYALMPPCVSISQVDCIESVYAKSSSSPTRAEGVFQRFMPESVTAAYAGDLARGLPAGSSSGIWRIPGVKHKGNTDEYAVVVSSVGSIRKGTPNVAEGDFRAAIFPMTLDVDAGYRANQVILDDRGTPGYKHVSILQESRRNFEACAIVENGACALRQGFPDDVHFGMTIRFGRTINGWLHGRISQPVIDYQQKSYGTRIDMQGLSTKVPLLAGWVSQEKLTQRVRLEIGGLSQPGGYNSPGTSGEEVLRTFPVWSRLLGDTAVANPSQWIFYNLPEGEIQNSDNCIRNSKVLAGFLTTNSSTYSAGPPVFNKETQSLDYKVASAHFLKDGTVFQGEYNLFINSQVARCIYKFSGAPISASVSIVNDSGDARIATTTVRESGGWIHLMAAGFTFSSPTLRVTLSQSPVPTPTATPKAAAKKITISCVKGKVVKKVTAVKPTCPAGYRKK